MQDWIGNAAIIPENWGWTLRDGKLEASSMDSDPAPSFCCRLYDASAKLTVTTGGAAVENTKNNALIIAVSAEVLAAQILLEMKQLMLMT